MNLKFVFFYCILQVSMGFFPLVSGQTLERRPFMGIQLGPVTEEIKNAKSIPVDGGIHILKVYDQSSAQSSGLLEGDVVVMIGNQKVESVPQFMSLLKPYKTGDKTELEVYRNGKKLLKTLTLAPLPFESYPQAEVSYGQVVTPHGNLRTILTRPEGKLEKTPVVFIIQGIDCSSIDNPFGLEGALSRLVQSFHAQGYATFRVEKSGVGDSKGKPCRDCDFREDLAGFREGLKVLKNMPGIDPQNVFLVGLSMGGVWAPLIAAEEPVKGIVVYGTLVRPFAEYMLENSRRQDILAGKDYAEIEADLRQAAGLYHYLYYDKLSPEEIIHQHPELKQHFVAVSTDREGEPIRHLHADRLYTFQEQLANINLSEAWKKTDAAVLALWGKGDFVSNREDHRMIAEMVNFYHPGKGTFAEVEANHWFETAPDMETSFRTHEEGKNPELNPQVFTTILEWMKAVK